MSEATHEEVRNSNQELPLAMGRLAAHSVAHFYNADSIYIPLSLKESERGTDHLTVVRRRDGVRSTEVVGSGSEHDAMMEDSLQKMRSLETVRTKPVARIEIGGGRNVDFASLEHYSPRIAPSRDTYPVPAWATSLVAGKTLGADLTYRETIKQDGWQQEIRTVIDEYVADDADGAYLLSSLRIKSLDHLSPEQAVKLSVALVQNLSKYSEDGVGKLGHADTATTVDLLRDGLARKDDPSWQGNGVCRNIASNVKAVFESLKATQAELSMLNNTYAVFNGGLDGAGYRDKRRDPMLQEDAQGHAWNTFVTFDEHGSAAATIVDATHSLGIANYTSLQHLDFTFARMAAPMVSLFEQSTDKQATFSDVTYFLDTIATRRIRGRSFSEQIDMKKYVATEFLAIAGQLQEFPEDYQTPAGIREAIYRTRDRLSEDEVCTVFKLHEADSYSVDARTCQAIVGAYVNAVMKKNPASDMAKGFIFGNSELMRMVDDALTDEQRDILMADTNYGIRMRAMR